MRLEELPHQGFLRLDAPVGTYAAVVGAGQRRRSRRAQLTVGLAVVVAGALVGGAAAVSGLRTGPEQALMPMAAPLLEATSPLGLQQDPVVPAPVTAEATSGAPVPSTSAPASSRPSRSPSGSGSGSATVPSLSQPPSTGRAVAPSASARPGPNPSGPNPSGPNPSSPIPSTTVPAAAVGDLAAGCRTSNGRAVDAGGAPLADLVVARFVRGADGAVSVTVAARTGGDGRFAVPSGGSLMLAPTAPGVPQTRATRNLSPVWVGGGSFPGNPTACGPAADTVLPPGATLVGDHASPVDGTAQTVDTLSVIATAAGSPMALAPAVATITETGYRFVGLPVGVGAVLVDAFDHRRGFDVTAGSTREDWSSCTTCLAGKPTRGGAAQVDPTAPPLPSPEPGEPAPTGTPPPLVAPPSPTGTSAPSPDPRGSSTPTEPPGRA